LSGQKRRKLADDQELFTMDADQQYSLAGIKKSVSSLWEQSSNISIGGLSSFEKGDKATAPAAFDDDLSCVSGAPFTSAEELEIGQKQIAMIKNKQAARKYWQKKKTTEDILLSRLNDVET